MRQVLGIVAVVIPLLVSGGVAAQGTWVQVVGPAAATPAGFGDTGNIVAQSSEVLDGYLYIGTFNSATGTEIWRSAEGATWARVNIDGFGGTDAALNSGAYSMEAFNSTIYVGTWSSGAPMEPASDTRVWRFDGGVSWTKVASDGFGDSHNAEPWGMEVWDYLGTPILYVGAANFGDGAELWRNHYQNDWVQANANGFGNTSNSEISSLLYWNNYLYAATGNYATGVELWRSSLAFSVSGSWDRVNASPGFGGATHVAAYAMVVFDGYLYLSTYNTTAGGSVYRSSNGSTWNVVPQSVGGFGDANNWGSYAMVVHDGALYLGTFNWTTGAEVWRTSNGTTWTQVNGDGFGSASNFGVYSFAEFDGVLYAGLRNHSGCQVWKLALFADGFESGNSLAWSFATP